MLGHEISIFDISEASRKKSVESGYSTYSSLQEALDILPEIVLICSDTSSHIPLCQEVLIHNNSNLKGIFCEKPLSYNLDGVSTIVNICKERNIKLMVSENLRFNRGIELVKILLDNNSIGKVFACNYFFGSWLPDWRPNTDYKSSYSSKEQGGIARDDIHAPALMLHLFGPVTKTTGILYNTHTLEIVEDDIADYILQHNNGIISHIHSNYLLPFYCRTLEICGLEGSIQFDYVDQIVNIRTKGLDVWRTFDCSCDKNNMYSKQLQYYISCIENNIEPYHNGIKALEIATKLKEQNNVK